jgi:hypothetical protein
VDDRTHFNVINPFDSSQEQLREAYRLMGLIIIIHNCLPIFIAHPCLFGLRWRSRYSDLLRVGRSGDLIPVEARYSAPVKTSPGAHPASCKMGTGSLYRGKAAWASRWPPTPSSAKVKKRVELYVYSPAQPSWPFLGCILNLFIHLFSRNLYGPQTIKLISPTKNWMWWNRFM